MAEIFGVVAAGIMLGPELLRLSRSLRKTFKAIRYAPHDLDKLVKEMEIFADLYEDFHDVCTSDPKYKARSSGPAKRLMAWAEEAVHGFKKLLARVQALTGDSLNSKLDTLIARVRWYFSEDEVKFLRSSLSVARESMRGFSNIRVIEKLDEQMRLLKAAIAKGSQRTIEDQLGVDLEEQIRMLVQKKRNRRQQRHAIEKRLDEAKIEMTEQHEKVRRRDVVPDTRQLLQFAKSVEHYVEQVLPSEQPGERRRNPRSRTTAGQRSNRNDSTQPSVSTGATSFASEPSSSLPPREPSPLEAEIAYQTPDSECCVACTGLRILTEAPDNVLLGTVKWLQPSGFVEATYVDGSVRQTRKRYEARNRDGTVQQDPPFPVHALYEIDAASEASFSTGMPELIIEHTDVLVEGRRVPLGELLHRDESSDLNSHKSKRPRNDDQRMEMSSKSSSQSAAGLRSMEALVVEDVNDRDEAAHSNESIADDNETESESEEEMNKEEEEEAPSPFQPVAGTMGNFPKGWQTRLKRSESPQDFWHKRL